ncbi:MAG: acyl-CoA dehydrogenase family protein [Lachnospiraceae bacterium]|nr:acyl-CoA dehydrogenase family protein [Lachnospiraceae bacterium]
MGYILNEEQMELVNLAKKFAEQEVKPIAAECDREGKLPMEAYRKGVEIGFNALEIPEEYGGAGADYYTIAAVMEEFAKVDAGFATGIGASSLALKPVLIAGTPEQKKYFADFITGDKGNGFAAFGLTEPDAGSDAAAGKTIAVKDGDEWVINGRKCFITNAGLASIFVIFAITDKTRGTRGISAFIVERDRPGLSIGKEEDKMGIRLSNTADVILEDVRVPEDHLLGELGKGFVYAMQTLDLARPTVASMAVGVAQRALEEATAYAKQRVTFGKPIINHQAIMFKLADMDMKTEVARSAIKNFYDIYYSGRKNFSREAAIAKCFAGDISVEVALDAIQILGGYGYSREYPVEKLLRDAKIMQIYEGTNEVQRMVIGGALMR